MTANALTLLGYGLTAILDRPTSRSHPRTRIETPTLSRTAYGAVNRRGTAYEPPHLWECSFIVNEMTWQTLSAVFDLYFQSPSGILLYDEVQPYVEATRTRALVPGTTAGSLGSNVVYFAQFIVEFPDSPKSQALGLGWYQVDFQLLETDKTQA